MAEGRQNRCDVSNPHRGSWADFVELIYEFEEDRDETKAREGVLSVNQTANGSRGTRILREATSSLTAALCRCRYLLYGVLRL